MGRLDELGGAVRRIIGDLADDRGVYYKFSDIADPSEAFPGQAVLSRARGYVPPPAGSESGMLQPFELIRRSAYPEGLAEQALTRLRNSSLQAEYGPNHIPLLVRPSSSVSTAGDSGRHISLYDLTTGTRTQAMDVAGASDEPLRTLIHEARHATERAGNDNLRALRSVTAQEPTRDGMRLKDASKRYYARPSELLAYLSEAGDDFVRERGRLVENVRDASAVMERIEAGESLARLNPLVRQMYAGAYKQSPVARKRINDILTRYFAVPASAAAASVDGGDD